MKTKLKPCPFCGGETTWMELDEWCCIMCTKCYSRGDVYLDKGEAIEAWNRRMEEANE